MHKKLLLGLLLTLCLLCSACVKQPPTVPGTTQGTKAQQTEESAAVSQSNTMGTAGEGAATQTQPASAASSQKETTTAPATKTQTTAPGAATQPPAPGTIQVTLQVDCANAVAYGIRKQTGYAQLIPENGELLKTVLTMSAGATALEALRQGANANNIVVSERRGYINGIQGLMERDCGASSGWLYLVNGVQPAVSSAQYTLQNADTVVFVYTCKPGDIP